MITSIYQDPLEVKLRDILIKKVRKNNMKSKISNCTKSLKIHKELPN